MYGMRSLAAAQTVPTRGDVTANLAQHLQLMALAADAGAQLLVFPELSLTGYELELVGSQTQCGWTAKAIMLGAQNATAT